MSDIRERLDYLVERLGSAYDSIGHSSGRPFVYFVYPPEQELLMRALAEEHLRNTSTLCFHHVDLLPLTIETLSGQEERRQALLNSPGKHPDAPDAVMRLWARAVGREIAAALQCSPSPARPVVVLRGLAALHPLGDPTALMEAIGEQEMVNPATGRMPPVVILVPGIRPPQTSRTYLFLGREDLRKELYRGEEV